MSIQEVKKVLTHGYRDFLVANGFDKPATMSSEMVFRHAHYPDRRITISTAPMFQNCVFYEFKVKGLDDKQSIFCFSPDVGHYTWPGIGWFEYRDFEELVQVFGYIRRIHVAWLNRIFNQQETGEFVDRLNRVRRESIEKTSGYSQEQRKAWTQQRVEEQDTQYQGIRNQLGDDWAAAVVESLQKEGKMTKRIGVFRIEDTVIRGPRFDGEYRIVDRYVVGPNTEQEFWIVKNQVFGPNGKEPFFVVDGTIFGTTNEMPWFKNRVG